MRLVDVLALSFTATLPVQSVANGLTDLRHMLPPHVRVWVGGSSPALRRKFDVGVHPVTGLNQIDKAVAEWRQLLLP
jgi:hypothetical protein